MDEKRKRLRNLGHNDRQANLIRLVGQYYPRVTHVKIGRVQRHYPISGTAARFHHCDLAGGAIQMLLVIGR